ncbi:hypothetical protein FLAG1_06637 [Fusarium langsethiae]|uniref:Uncharacterized protein n=1 Tax=Fusarium langsethiae TaxID=179993 RepID=A0A0M9EVE5_FUSLA|nr:hypothetical protein FLAG1_06637 [Fusarium langsethiae]GKU02780.1 unnamed protein product [Fusarium langsethiae]GKU18287.1 unnamed protein product [Fusarium langsethiae]
MAGRDSTNNPNIPKDQDSQKERLFYPANPLRFAASKVNKATNNNNQDRRTVEQWQLDNANAYVDEITAHLRHCQEEIARIKNHIGRIDAVQDVAEKQATTPEKAVRGRSLPRKIMSFSWSLLSCFSMRSSIMSLMTGTIRDTFWTSLTSTTRASSKDIWKWRGDGQGHELMMGYWDSGVDHFYFLFCMGY